MIMKAIIQLCGSSNILVVQQDGNPRNLGGQFNRFQIGPVVISPEYYRKIQ